MELGDGRKIIFLNTRGENDGEVPEELVKFLKFVKADLKESQEDFQDAYVKQLQDFITKIKSSREMEERFMIFEEMLRDERREGRTEGRTEILIGLLEMLGNVPETLREKISAEKSVEVLLFWTKLAAQSTSVEEFEEKAGL